MMISPLTCHQHHSAAKAQDPIDLSTVGERLAAGFYGSLEMFAADLRRMFANARVYNAPETHYFKIAGRLEAFFNEHLASHLVMD